MRKPSCQGFTIIEVLVTLAIVGFGMLVIYRAFFSSLGALAHLANRIDAMEILHDEIHEARYTVRDSMTLSTTRSRGETTIGRKSYEHVSSVAAVNEKAGLFSVDVSARWPEGGLQKRTGRQLLIYRVEREQ